MKKLFSKWIKIAFMRKNMPTLFVIQVLKKWKQSWWQPRTRTKTAQDRSLMMWINKESQSYTMKEHWINDQDVQSRNRNVTLSLKEQCNMVRQFETRQTELIFYIEKDRVDLCWVGSFYGLSTPPGLFNIFFIILFRK